VETYVPQRHTKLKIKTRLACLPEGQHLTSLLAWRSRPDQNDLIKTRLARSPESQHLIKTRLARLPLVCWQSTPLVTYTVHLWARLPLHWSRSQTWCRSDPQLYPWPSATCPVHNVTP